MTERAILLDRDGTLVHARHYPSTPEELQLYDGVTPHLRALQGAGFRLVVVTNQAGIARGLFTTDDLAIMHEYLTAVLEAEGVHIDRIYHCPHHVDGVIPQLAIACECRKPQPGMLLQAAHDLNLDLAASWFVGDILDDVEAGNRAECRTVLVDLGTESLPEGPLRTPSFVARDTVHALRLIEAEERLGPACQMDYSPASWREDRSIRRVS
jgi:D-glycero-D-manno-heptose 1,7-bisphosphate phosphatase